MQYINDSQARQFEEQCKTHYYNHQLQLIDKPAPSQNRQCTDTCCMIIFASLFIAFVAYSSFSIHSILKLGFTTLDTNDNVTFLMSITQPQFQRLGIIVAACIAGSVVIGIVVLISLKCCPQIMIGLMAFITMLTIAAVGLIDAVAIKTGVATYFFLIAVIYAGFIFGFWDNLTKAAILMKTVGNFIAQNLKILLLVFFALLYCGIMLFLWVGGFYSFCTLYSHGELSFGGFVVSFIFWVFMLIFFNFYFYYTSVFITANAISIWFFDKTDQFDLIASPFKLMVRYHLGTITFASLIITFGKLLKLFLILARFKNTQNAVVCLIGSFAHCVIGCCLGAIEAIIEVINNYAIIMCSLTGHSLMDSAKIVGQLIFNDPQGVFSEFTFSTYVVNIGGVLTISIIPTLVGGILLRSVSGPLWALSVIMIFFTTSMIGLLMLQMFVESASTLFLLYTLDGKLSEQGLNVVWIDKFAAELEKGFDQAFVGKIQKKNIKTRTITTIIVHANGAVQTYNEQVIQGQDDPNLMNVHSQQQYFSSQNKLTI